MRKSVFGALSFAVLLTVGAGCAPAEPPTTEPEAPLEQGMPVPGTQTPEMEVKE